MKRAILTLAALSLGLLTFAQEKFNITQADKDRAAKLVEQMTLDEKISLISGKIDEFHTFEISRLGIPSVRLADGPQGVRNNTKSTYYPCGMSAAASWNRAAVRGMGTGIGYDARARGVGIMLCPGVNIYRSALCGRNFEYFGEDPYLASETAVQYIEGMQEQKVLATIKHFALNNQEYQRHAVASNASERAMNEIYFPTFRKAVEQAKVGCVMTCYGRVNGYHGAESPFLIKQTLRGWGFDGIVMSDWSSTYSPILCLQSGLDLEVPKDWAQYPEVVKELLANGAIEERLLDEKCTHILQTFSAAGFLDNPMKDESIPEDYEKSHELAYNLALEGPVLLKNDGILPIKKSNKNNIVVIGPNANKIACGGGSGIVTAIEGRTITLAEGLQTLGKGYKVTALESPDADALKKATAVIVGVGFDSDTEREAADRTYTLPEGQDELIKTVLGYNKNVVVVANSGGEFDVSGWIDDVKALIMAWYGGESGGKALAALISGEVSPSGKLPFTFWGSLDKNPLQRYYDPFNFRLARGRQQDKSQFVEYREGVFVGYRGIEHFGVKPMFAFGYGLTYTNFEYSNLSVTPSGDGYDVSFKIKNSGKAEASEVAQVYVAPVSPSVVRPSHELKGYDKVKIAAGKESSVKIHLDADAFKYYDATLHDWMADPGQYKIQVAASEQDVRLETTVLR